MMFVDHSRGLSCAFALALANGCSVCNDAGCSWGVEVEIVTTIEQPVPPATYIVDVTADDIVLRATCTVADTFESSHCVEESIEGDREIVDFSISLRGERGPSVIEPPRGDLPRAGAGESEAVHGFFVGVGETHTHRDSIEHTGPEAVSIRIARETQEVFAQELEPEYEREHHRGPDRCGFCDFASIDISWSPPPPA